MQHLTATTTSDSFDSSGIFNHITCPTQHPNSISISETQHIWKHVSYTDTSHRLLTFVCINFSSYSFYHFLYCQMRVAALQTMEKAFCTQKQLTLFPLSDFVNLLAFEDNEEVMLCVYYVMTDLLSICNSHCLLSIISICSYLLLVVLTFY